MAWLDSKIRSGGLVQPQPLKVELPESPPPPPPPLAPPTGMPTKDEFVAAAAPKPGMPALGVVAGPPPAQDLIPQEAQAVAESFRTGGASAAAQKLQELVNQHHGDPATGADPTYADKLLQAAQPTLEQVSQVLGHRAGNDVDDDTKDAFGKKDVTRDTLTALAAVAEKAGPEALKSLGKTLATGLPDDGQLNQFDDVLKSLKKDHAVGVARLGGATVTELQGLGKQQAAKELSKDHDALDYGGRWKPGQPLSEAKNAHLTNTQEQFADAVNSDHNWFEGDVQLNSDGVLEMSHGEGGNQLSLKDWLAKGKELGVGMKLDIKFDDPKVEDPAKQKAAFEEMLKLAKESGIPDERLMFNVGIGETKQFGSTIRELFPNATLAVNPSNGDGKLNEAEAKEMIAVAEQAGPGPVTYVVNYDSLTHERYAKNEEIDASLKLLEEKGSVSVWNSYQHPGKSPVGDPKQATEELRERGVTGVVDLRKSPWYTRLAEY
ncbi:FAM151 family protein [Myxococcus eversor]|uniref:FAM151 family protein n=1 Tax=Myxococcus eversor TaxID=2709661 RepID=UPI0013D8A105|nr:FAM151 family protein [Myxococcus eversor]